MIGRLVVLLEGESFAKMIASDAATSVAEPIKPACLVATRERVIDHLKRLTIPRRKATDESAAQDAIGYHLVEAFEDVVPQYNIGGYLGLKIDIDLGNGRVGVEVKLAESLLKAKAAEAHRLIGQAVYYQKRRYQDNLIVAVVGRSGDLEAPMLKELGSFLESVGVTYVGVLVS